MQILSVLRKLLCCCFSNTDPTEDVHLEEPCNKSGVGHLNEALHIENNPGHLADSSDTVNGIADPRVDPSVASNPGPSSSRTQTQHAHPAAPEDPSSTALRDVDEVKMLVEQVKTSVIQSVNLLHAGEDAERDSLRRRVWDQVIRITDSPSGDFDAVNDPASIVDRLKEDISVPDMLIQAARSTLIDLFRLAFRIRDKKADGGAYYKFVWGDTDEEHMQELTLLKDGLPLLARLDLLSTVSRPDDE